MAKDHGVMTGTSDGGLNLDDLKEEEILKKKRMEAQHIYEKFQAPAKTEQIEDPSKIYIMFIKIPVRLISCLLRSQ
jgi:hypothetical protein